MRVRVRVRGEGEGEGEEVGRSMTIPTHIPLLCKYCAV